MTWFDRLYLPKETVDALLDTVSMAVVNELENCKKNIDANEDGKVSIKEMKLYVKSIIRILKSFIRGF